MNQPELADCLHDPVKKCIYTSIKYIYTLFIKRLIYLIIAKQKINL